MTNNKVLTVSYGSFSCTLEGFEDSFETMKAIAEYFRDIAASDPTFGSALVPPDLEMITQIARQDTVGDVDAHEEDGHFYLRASDHVAETAEQADIDGMANIAAETQTPSVLIPQVTAKSGNGIAARLQRIRDAAAERAKDTGVQTRTTETRSPLDNVFAETNPDQNAVADEFAGAAHDDEAQEIDAVSVDVFAAPEDVEEPTQDELATGFADHDADANDVGPLKLAAFQVDDTEDEEEEVVVPPDFDASVEFDDHEDADAAAELREAVTEDPADVLDALLRAREVQEAEIAEASDVPVDANDTDVADETPAISDPLSSIMSQIAAAEDDSEFEDEAPEVEEQLSDSSDLIAAVISSHSKTAEDDEAEEAVDPSSPEAEAPAAVSDILARMARARDTDEPADDQTEADEPSPYMLEDDASPSPLALAEDETSESDLVETEALEEVAELQDDHADDDESQSNVTHLSAYEAPRLPLSAENDDDAGSEETKRKAVVRKARIIKVTQEDITRTEEANSKIGIMSNNNDAPQTPSQNDVAEAVTEDDDLHVSASDRVSAKIGFMDIDRLMTEAESQMGEPESTIRRSAFAHLKAAVAARRNDDGISRKEPADQSEDDYRSDLANAVSNQSEGEESAPSTDTTEVPTDDRTLALVTETPSAEADFETSDDTAGFPQFAQEHAATTLPDLLEAAAAYMSYVEGRQQFSRPQLMTKVREVEKDNFSREDGLRCFGQLLRSGKIEKIKGGRFGATKDIGFRPSEKIVS